LGISAWRIGGISPFFFVGIVLVFIIWFILSKTNLGLRIRSVGEDPSVAEVSGINVERTRYLCVIVGGMLGGLSGAFLSLSYLGVWSHNLAGGLGWIALALVFFSMWRPWLLFAGALLFGALWQIALSPEAIFPSLALPLEVYRAIPFAATIAVLIIISTKRFRRKMGLAKPAALGLPYAKE
jgi:simple sugar transport system permease protein